METNAAELVCEIENIPVPIYSDDVTIGHWNCRKCGCSHTLFDDAKNCGHGRMRRIYYGY